MRWYQMKGIRLDELRYREGGIRWLEKIDKKRAYVIEPTGWEHLKKLPVDTSQSKWVQFGILLCYQPILLFPQPEHTHPAFYNTSAPTYSYGNTWGQNWKEGKKEVSLPCPPCQQADK